MRVLSFIAVLVVALAFGGSASAEEAAAENVAESVDVAVAPATLIELDAAVKDDGDDSVRETRQFRTFGGGFGRPRPFYGGGFGRPRPFYGGGFGRPYYGGGGGFYRPRPYYGGGGFYRPPPFYGGFYGPRPFYGGGFYG